MGPIILFPALPTEIYFQKYFSKKYFQNCILFPYFTQNMFSRKTIISILFIGITSLSFPVFADDISDMKGLLTDTITKLTQKYEAQIQILQAENTALKQEIASLKGTGAIVIQTIEKTPTTIPLVTPIKTTRTITATMTKTDIYNTVIAQVNENLGNILSENNLPAYAAIGLFEFIEPNAFFISIDDGKNPMGVSAFKTKILYTFNNNLILIKKGFFDLDYISQRYVTTFGSNPYTKATRTRIINPTYKGKLLDPVSVNNTTNTTTQNTPSPAVNIVTGDVTFAQIKTAYDNTKLLDALKLSDNYILKDPNNIDVLRIRYRSYYIIGKYEESLAEIKKMETIQGSNFERTIACDAAVIGKIAKKTDVSSYYSAICKKQ
ncbi:hypothetical protein AUK10_01425 [Candidatus Gracilibacteria bacterium CG2_30_37_12]|nr:MAG: hypothetical protein AUK10_01425 [Candidatus Gracilibacteria bacterium CG2_30_37_12]